MTIPTGLTPHIYGAGELGVLAVTAPGTVHPRVHYLGAELFVGLDDAGVAVTQGQAQAWPTDFTEVLASTLATGTVPAPVDGVITLTDEGVSAQVLVDPGTLEGVALEGAPVVWALSRTTVLVSGADDPRGVAAVLEHAERLCADEAPLVSIHPLVLDQGQWGPYDWRAATSDQTVSVHRVIRLFGVWAYELQTRALTEPVRNRPGLTVVDPKVHVREDGVTVTFASYPVGSAALLPVVDNVIIADPATKSLASATFEEFLDSLGDQAVRTELSPARYFIPATKTES